MRVLRPLCLAIVAILATCAVVSAQLAQQQSPPTTAIHATMDAQSAALIPRALAALNGPTAVSDVTLTGTVTRTAGSDSDTGTITLKALGPYDSRVDIVTGGGSWTEVHSAVPPHAPEGYTVGPDGVQHKIAGHNTTTDAVWFLPALSSLAKLSNPQLTVSYVGAETKGGVSLEHLHFVSRFPAPNPTLAAKLPKSYVSRAAALNAVDLYVDPATSLPAILAFNTHPDNNAMIDIPVEVRFSSYQQVNGVSIPFHIQKFLNGTSNLDITIQSASLNSGLSATDFAVQ